MRPVLVVARERLVREACVKRPRKASVWPSNVNREAYPLIRRSLPKAVASGAASPLAQNAIVIFFFCLLLHGCAGWPDVVRSRGGAGRCSVERPPPVDAAPLSPCREVGRAQRIQLRLPDLKRLHRLLAGDRSGYELHHRVADMRDTQSV